MDSVTESLVLDLLEWLAQLDRSYDEVIAIGTNMHSGSAGNRILFRVR
jgi:hypothetical protein